MTYIVLKAPLNSNQPTNQPTPGRRAKYFDQRICMAVCLSACVFQTTCLNVTTFSVRVTLAVPRSFADGSAIRYILPVLWMTSCFYIM